MGPGREAQTDGGALYGTPSVFRSPPLTSESTDADENNPNLHGNSKSPHYFFRLRSSSCVSLSKDVSRSSGAGLTDFTSHEDHGRECKECGSKSVGNFKIAGGNITNNRPRRQGAAVSVDGCDVREQVSAQEGNDPPPVKSPSYLVTTISPWIASEVASDDGVVVYIDESEDDFCEARLITENKINSSKAADIGRFKSRWVAQMLARKGRILRGTPRSAAKDRDIKAAASAAGTSDAPPVACGLEFFKRKLEAFAACMSTEALECIHENSQSWGEVSSEFSDSDEPGGIDLFSCSVYRGLPKGSPNLPLRNTKSPHFATKLGANRLAANKHLNSNVKGGTLNVSAAIAALDSWQRFRRYAKKTCRALSPRPRIEPAVGLESDDDDEQAPLYMCRPGSVQRPSPLISHSLTEHLKMSRTLFFKQFGKREGVAPFSAVQTGRSLEQQGQKATLSPSSPLLFPNRSACSLEHEKQAHSLLQIPAPERSSHEAVPLYRVTAEASAMFGDLMRLEDTARMLKASCTFRLAAAPGSKIRNRYWNSSRHGKVRTRGKVSKSAQAEDSCPPNMSCSLSSPCERKKDGFILNSSASSVAASGSRTSAENKRVCRLSTSSETPFAASDEAGTQNQILPAAGHEGGVVYTVQADDDTLALSGLDAEYCARVRCASQGAHRAAESLAYLEEPESSKTTPHNSGPASSAGPKKRRKTPKGRHALFSGEESTGSDEEGGLGRAPRVEVIEEGDNDRSSIADKFLLAHLMPYLPQMEPE